MGRLRRHAKDLAARTRNGDTEAARALVAHSVMLGHGRLALRRLLLAQAMGASDLQEFQSYCKEVERKLPPETFDQIFEETKKMAEAYLGKTRTDG